MKYPVFIFFISLVFTCTSQTNRRYCYDIRVGLSQLFLSDKNFESEENIVDEHDNVQNPYLQLSKNKTAVAPYFNGSYSLRYNPYFEFYAGFTYTQYKTDVIYMAKTYEPNPASTNSYFRTVITAPGTMITNLYRLEFAPILRIKNTKIIFGLLNIQSTTSRATFSGTIEKQDVIPKTVWYFKGTPPADSIVTVLSSDAITPTKKINDQLLFPLSIGIEQEIPVKKWRFLAGLKYVYSRRAIAPFALTAYVGIRFSKAYTSQE